MRYFTPSRDSERREERLRVSFTVTGVSIDKGSIETLENSRENSSKIEKDSNFRMENVESGGLNSSDVTITKIPYKRLGN